MSGQSASGNPHDEHEARTGLWRLAAWSGAAILLLIPLVAMQFTNEVNWDITDFAVFGAMLLGAGLALELLLKQSDNTAYKGGAAVALLGAFLLVWVNLAVGLVGSENNPANLAFFGVLALGALTSIVLRFEAAGMTRALVAMSLAQAGIAVAVVIAGAGTPWGNPVEVLLLNGFFAGLWLLSAWLFRRAASA